MTKQAKNSNMKTYGFIFARGGSKGLPGKNIRLLNGKPLIAWAIEAGKKSGMLDRIIVSTDSEDIAAAARTYGAETPFMRPAELATDTASEWLAWQHAVRFFHDKGDHFDIFVSLPATAPLKTPENIRDCIDLYSRGKCDAVITCMEASRSPYFNMISIDKDGYANIAIEGNKLGRRQDAPKVYDVTTVAYVTSPQYILASSHLMDGKIKAQQVDRISGVDIDEAIDFEIAEFLMKKRMEQQ